VKHIDGGTIIAKYIRTNGTLDLKYEVIKQYFTLDND